MEVVTRLREAVHRKWPELSPIHWSIHHGNAPAHEGLSVKQFLAQKSITAMEHPPSSPDFAPNDYLQK
jgi:hypothetical protein